MSDETQLGLTAVQLSGASDNSARTTVAAEYRPPLATLPEMVAAQAAVTPDATALTAGADELSYAELDRRSNRLARYLASVGIGRDQLVGLCMERSPAMVVAALAILKAGGAYVPLDFTLPADRLDFILRDAEPRVVVTADGLTAKLLSGDWRVVDLNLQAIEIAAFSCEPLVCPATPENLAYVIYTSGSTGQPKGVEIVHRGLANLVSWHVRVFGVTRNDRASHQAALGFDAAVWEIWPYLAAGASVHIPPELCRTSPDAMQDWLETEQITITFLPTPLAERMLLLKWSDQTALRILLTGADTLHHGPSRDLPFALVNNYGPTECTVVATSGTVVPRDAASPCSSNQYSSDQSTNRLPSIGRPIDNTQIYIVNEEMQQVPPGTVGELCVAGAGLARGYHKRAELTLQKFVHNPFRSKHSANGNSHFWDRLYRTGDLARLLPNGETEFMGRLDEQIKIRGFRIEPGEIIGVLNEHSDVQVSTVVARENRSGEKSLVAYVVLAPVATLSSNTLRAHLTKRLPDYMVPAAFVRMEALPMTANGKIDRAALPVPCDDNRLGEDNFVAPSGPVQERLAVILASLLRVERIGANDNFFLLGGHSLLGTQLIARVSGTFGVELPLLQLFDHPTLAEMSDAIETLILAKLETASAGDAHRLHAD
ncbi:MAG: amino acid adenylation domain-containing protein [Candidatus Sulfotelmatobacter sp.]